MQCTARLAPFTLSLLLACGPGAPAEPTGGSTSTGGDPGTGPTPTTGPAGTSTGGEAPATTSTGPAEPNTTGDATTTDATTGEAMTTEATTTEATTIDATTGAVSATTGGETTGGSDSTGADETTAAVELETHAWWVDGQTLQIRVIQEDPAAGLCRGVLLGLDMFVSDKYKAVAAPQTWAVETVFVHDGPGPCFDPYMWYTNQPVFAAEATGTVVFHDIDDKGMPMTIDLDVTATYAPDKPWIPATDSLLATAVKVVVG